MQFRETRTATYGSLNAALADGTSLPPTSSGSSPRATPSAPRRAAPRGVLRAHLEIRRGGHRPELHAGDRDRRTWTASSWRRCQVLWLQEAEDDMALYKGKLVAVFWDWATSTRTSRKARSKEQTKPHNVGLKNVNLWFCNSLTLTLMNRRRQGKALSYDEGGWQLFERGVAISKRQERWTHPCWRRWIRRMEEKTRRTSCVWPACGELAKQPCPFPRLRWTLGWR